MSSNNFQERIEKLFEAGSLDWNGEKLLPMKPIAVSKDDKTVAELLLDDRDQLITPPN